MRLIVHVRGLGENSGVLRQEVNTFADQEKVAARIARAVRNWIRVVPVRSGGTRLDLRVLGEWVEDVGRIPQEVAEEIVRRHQPKRKRKASK